ncbi:MAG: hypothetical protein RBU23_11195 [Candidatus Auribacterota bacterium]|nr:hypothetical protein [Candidatus Auribacterota bacterium]
MKTTRPNITRMCCAITQAMEGTSGRTEQRLALLPAFHIVSRDPGMAKLLFADGFLL